MTPPATTAPSPFAAARCPGGVIEGFYGPPWNDAERRTLLDWMARFGLGVYLHAPKDDPWHRAAWREPYPAADAERLAALIAECRRRDIEFVWGVGPGLDLRHAFDADAEALLARLRELHRLGCRSFALLLDDIPDSLAPADAARFGSLAAAQAHVANRAWEWIAANAPGGSLLVCPTPYCGRMAAAGLGGPDYLATLGRLLAPAIDVFWTGPEIVSATITPEDLAPVAALLRRPPVLWDNLFADDYDGARFFAGPYSGRPRSLRPAVRGILLNPNNELPLDFVPLHTFSRWLDDSAPWDPRAAFLEAVRDWLPAFRLFDTPADLPPREPVSLEDLVLLADCFYGPQEHGAGAAALLAGAERILRLPPRSWGEADRAALDAAARLKRLGYRLADLVDRPLLHSLARRLWPLREECTLLLHHAENSLRAARGERPRPDDDHLPGTFRGGFLADLERIVPVPWAASASAPSAFVIRPARPDDEAAAYRVCLETGDDGADGTPFYRDDPDALGRIFVGPYFAFAADLAWVVEDDEGVCGYCLATDDSDRFYARCEREWRPALVARFAAPQGDRSAWSRVEQIHHLYHHPDHLVPGPVGRYPAHVHIDLLPRAQGRRLGGRMIGVVLDELRRRGVPGVHLGVGTANRRARAFYAKLGFADLCQVGGADGCTYMGLPLDVATGAAS